MIWSSFRGAGRDPVGAAVTGAATADDSGGWSGDSATASADSPWRGWLTGAGTNLLNPKVGVFYIATIPQFLPDGISPLLMGAALAGIHAVLTMAWFAVLIIGGGYARRWLSSPRSLAVIDRMTGVVLMVFGGTLLADALTGTAPAAAGAPTPGG